MSRSVRKWKDLFGIFALAQTILTFAPGEWIFSAIRTSFIVPPPSRCLFYRRAALFGGSSVDAENLAFSENSFLTLGRDNWFPPFK